MSVIARAAAKRASASVNSRREGKERALKIRQATPTLNNACPESLCLAPLEYGVRHCQQSEDWSRGENQLIGHQESTKDVYVALNRGDSPLCVSERTH